MSELEPGVRDFIVSHRVARLATADEKGAPHVVPICYAYDGRHMYSALDRKPKAVEALRLKRVRNVQANPRVALVIDDYREDWVKLAYVLVQGLASILMVGAERDRAEALLRGKYPQYHDLLDKGCAMLRIVPDNIVVWASEPGALAAAPFERLRRLTVPRRPVG